MMNVHTNNKSPIPIHSHLILSCDIIIITINSMLIIQKIQKKQMYNVRNSE